MTTFKEKFKKKIELLSWTSDEKQQNANSCYEIMIHKLCNEKCLFCSQDHERRLSAIMPSDADIFHRILLWKKQWYWMLWFTWGEPLIHPNILKYVKFASKIWFNLIRVQTNGVMLWYPWFAKKCIDAGVTYFKISVHHYKSEIHDYLVWLPWALNNVLKWIEEIQKYWWRIWINIVLTKQNYKDLVDFFNFFFNKWITDYVMIFPLYEWSMYEQADIVGLKYSDAIPEIIKVLKIFDKAWLKRPLVLNIPLCMMPWYETAIIQTFNWTAVLNLDWTKSNIDENKDVWKKRIKHCSTCKYNKICFGIDKTYCKLFWLDEFECLPTQTELNYIYNKFNDFTLKKSFFTEDEKCILELFKKKNPLTVNDIITLKDDIQICKDCDSLNKIISTMEILVKKWLVNKQLVNWKIIFIKN